jgi:hypothetical protein
MTYLAIVLFVAAGVSAYILRVHGIFACQASGYGSDRYLAYCNTEKYGDYDHGAFWFRLEPEAVRAATDAQVLFIGNSRMQFGLSTAATADGFASLGVRYYLLGFAQNANHLFEAPLLDRLRPRASVYVINLDLFFEQVESAPAHAVMRDSNARVRYEQKRDWQWVHKPVCTYLSRLCGNKIAFFRSPMTGAWVVTGRGFENKPVSYDPDPDPLIVESYVQKARAFLARLPVRRECVVLTTVPTVNTGMGSARAIAERLGMPLISPQLAGLETFDHSHLDRPSAQRWSEAFMAAAEPHVRQCVAAHVEMPKA